MTINQHIRKSLSLYPTLYLCDNFEDSKFRVLNQKFLVSGNGYDWANTVNPEEGGYLVERNRYSKEFDKDFSKFLPKELKNVERFFKKFLLKNENNPVIVEERRIFCLFKGGMGKRNPYPKFSGNYSFLQRLRDGKFVQKNYVENAIWFFKECLKYFKDDKSCEDYVHAPKISWIRFTKLNIYSLTKKERKVVEEDCMKQATIHWDNLKQEYISNIEETLNLLEKLL